MLDSTTLKLMSIIREFVASFISTDNVSLTGNAGNLNISVLLSTTNAVSLFNCFESRMRHFSDILGEYSSVMIGEERKFLHTTSFITAGIVFRGCKEYLNKNLLKVTVTFITACFWSSFGNTKTLYVENLV